MENFDYGEMDFSDLMVDLPKPIGTKRNHSDMVTTDDEDFDFHNNLCVRLGGIM